jgi:hypothetical protein
VNGTAVLVVCETNTECAAATLADAVSVSISGDFINLTRVGSTLQPTNVNISHPLTIMTATPVTLTTEPGTLLNMYSDLMLEGDFSIGTLMNSPLSSGVAVASALSTHAHTSTLKLHVRSSTYAEAFFIASGGSVN